MRNNDLDSIIDYKNLYYDIKNKYDKISMELEELKIDNKLKDEEINLLRRKLNANTNSNLIRINYLEKKIQKIMYSMKTLIVLLNKLIKSMTAIQLIHLEMTLSKEMIYCKN